MSYTTFEFGKPKYNNKTGKLTVTIANTGKMDGDEVVQVYLKKVGDIDGPNKTLRAYKRVTLKAGEKQTVEIDLPRESFEWWDAATNTMRVMNGEFEVMVGNSSDDACLKKIIVKSL